MSIISLPKPNVAPTGGAALREMAYLSREATDVNMGQALIGAGRRMGEIAEGLLEYQDRQNRFLGDRASTELKLQSTKYAAEIGQRSDLHLVGGDGIVGFDRAGDEFEAQLAKDTQKLSERLPSGYRQQWLEQEQLKNEERTLNLRNGLIDLRTKYNRQMVLAEVDREAYGDPDKGILPDPYGGMRSLLKALEVIPSTEQQQFLADGMEIVARRAIARNPEWGKEFIETNSKFFLADKRDELLRGARADITANLIARDRVIAAAVAENDRKITAAVLSGEIAHPSEIIRRMKSDDPAEQVSEVTGRMMVDRLLERKKPDPQNAMASYGALSRATLLLENGKIDRAKWQSVFNAHANDLPDEKAYQFLSRAEEALVGGAKDKPSQFTSIRTDAEKLATDTLKNIHPTGADVPPPKEGETPNELLLDAALGDVMEKLETLIATKPKDQPVDPVMMRREINKIVTEVYEQEQKKKAVSNNKAGLIESFRGKMNIVNPSLSPGFGAGVAAAARVESKTAEQGVVLLPESPEPKDPAEFIAEVKRLDAISPTEGLRYYQRWRGKWQIKP